MTSPARRPLPVSAASMSGAILLLLRVLAAGGRAKYAELPRYLMLNCDQPASFEQRGCRPFRALLNGSLKSSIRPAERSRLGIKADDNHHQTYTATAGRPYAGSPPAAAGGCVPRRPNCTAPFRCPWPLPASLCRGPADSVARLAPTVSVVCAAAAGSSCAATACTTPTAVEAIHRFEAKLRAAASSSESGKSGGESGGESDGLLAVVEVSLCSDSEALGLQTSYNYSLQVAGRGGSAAVAAQTVYGGMAGLESLLQVAHTPLLTAY